MYTSFRTCPVLSVLFLSLVLLGGCSSSSSSGGDGPTGITLDELPGLSADANNHDLLYFTQSIEGDAGLFSINPAAPGAAVLVDGEIGDNLLGDGGMPPMIRGDNFDRILFPVHEVDLDPASGTIDNFRITRVFYGDGLVIDSLGFQRVTTDTADQFEDPATVGTEEMGAEFTSAMFSNDIEDADNTAILFQRGSAWKQLRVGDAPTTDPLELDERFTPVRPVFDPATNAGAGYIVVDSDQNDSLRFVDMSLSLVAGAVSDSGSPVADIEVTAALGQARFDGNSYVVIQPEGDEAEARLWFYEYQAGGPGSVSLVTNGSGEPFVFRPGLFGPGTITTPPENHITSLDGRMYFLYGEVNEDVGGLDPRLIRLDGDSWDVIAEPEGGGLFGLDNKFLVSGSNRLAFEADGEVISIHPDGSNEIVLDTHPDMFGQDISIGVLGAGNGWIFYNRSQGMMGDQLFAVAARLDGSDRLDIGGWQWIGASAGVAVDANAQLEALSVSEAFLFSEDHELAAVSSADPEAGMVNFGALPAGATEARLFGIAPGPHRLLQTTIEGDPNTWEVIHVDTRDETSMQVITSEASSENNQRPVSRF